MNIARLSILAAAFAAAFSHPAAAEAPPEKQKTELAATSRPKPAPESKKPQAADKDIPVILKIETAFEGYREGVLASDGEKAAKFVTKHIFDYFGRVKQWALYAPKEKIQALPFSDQVTILRLRAGFPLEKLSAISGRGLFIVSVRDGWLEKDYLKQVELKSDAQVDDSGDAALVPQTINGRVIPGLIGFQKENKVWKLNAYSLQLGSSFAFERSLRGMKDRREEMVESALSGITAKDFDQKWWNPLRKAPRGKKLEDLGLEGILPTQIPLSRRQQS